MAVLNAELRTAEGKSSLGRLRRSGVLPMAIIEKGKGTVTIQAPEKDVKDVLRNSGSLKQFQIKLDGESRPRDVILKKIDKDFIHNRLLHIAVLQVADTDVVTIDVPIRYVGTPEVVAHHEATLLHPTDHVKVKAKLKDIPEFIEVDVSALELGQSISVSDLQFPKDLEVLTSSEATIASVKVLRVQLEAEEPAEEAVEEGEAVEGEVPAEEGTSEE